MVTVGLREDFLATRYLALVLAPTVGLTDALVCGAPDKNWVAFIVLPLPNPPKPLP
jgi:hypothetical protein